MKKYGWFVVIFMFTLSSLADEAPRLGNDVRDLAQMGKTVTTEKVLSSLSKNELNATAAGNATKSALIKRADWKEIIWVGEAKVGAIVTSHYCINQEYCSPSTSFEVTETGRWFWTVWSGQAYPFTTNTGVTVEVAMFDKNDFSFELLSTNTYFGSVPDEYDTGISDVYSIGNQLVVQGQFASDTTVWIDGLKVPQELVSWNGSLTLSVSDTSLRQWRGTHAVTTVTGSESDTYVYRYAPRFQSGKGANLTPRE